MVNFTADEKLKGNLIPGLTHGPGFTNREEL
jgi:hypothetical protein